jgi:hypothetical protein
MGLLDFRSFFARFAKDLADSTMNKKGEREALRAWLWKSNAVVTGGGISAEGSRAGLAIFSESVLKV